MAGHRVCHGQTAQRFARAWSLAVTWPVQRRTPFQNPQRRCRTSRAVAHTLPRAASSPTATHGQLLRELPVAQAVCGSELRQHAGLCGFRVILHTDPRRVAPSSRTRFARLGLLPRWGRRIRARQDRTLFQIPSGTAGQAGRGTHSPTCPCIAVGDDVARENASVPLPA